MTLIAKNIRWFRKQQQISQTEFASIFGITRASVGAYEEGRAEPKLELISRFAKYYNVDLSSFIDEDMSLHSSNKVENRTQIETKEHRGAKSKSPFIHEMLETISPVKPIKDKMENNNVLPVVKKSKGDDILFYKSLKEVKKLSKSEWPFLTGSDAVFECTPHIERNTLRFRDGVFFICTKVDQEGVYNGVFIEQDRERLMLLEGELHKLDNSKNTWRVLYTVDTINNLD